MKIGIFGSSGHAREIADLAYSLNHDFIFIKKNNSKDLLETKYEYIEEGKLNLRDFDGFAIGVASNKIREKIFKKYENLNWINLIHPSASFGISTEDEIFKKKGLIICAGARCANSVILGNFQIINQNATIGHDCIIEDFVNISPGVNISGYVNIGKYSFLGTNSSIVNGTANKRLIITKNTLIGAGSLILQSITESGTYVGSPAEKL